MFALMDPDKQIVNVREANKSVRPNSKIIVSLYETVVKSADRLNGLYVIPSSQDPYEWFGVVMVRSGVFRGGIFRFLLKIALDFPNTTSLPIVKMLVYDIFHPQVNPDTKQLFLRRFVNGWTKGTMDLVEFLNSIQDVFSNIDENLDDPVNIEAADCYQNDREEFIRRVLATVKLSSVTVYDDPPEPQNSDKHRIKLPHWNEVEMRPFRKKLIAELSLTNSLNTRFERSMESRTREDTNALEDPNYEQD